MRRFSLVVGSALATFFLFAAASSAAPPTRTVIEADVTVPSPFFTQRCGVPVFIRLEVKLVTTLFYDRSGTLVRELDVFPGGFRRTYFSPLTAGGTGKSVTTVQHGRVSYVFSEGTDIGDAVIVTTVGPSGLTPPGGPINVGREVAEGTIVGFTPDGVPIVVPLAVISRSGQFTDPAAVIETRCSLLAGTSSV